MQKIIPLTVCGTQNYCGISLGQEKSGRTPGCADVVWVDRTALSRGQHAQHTTSSYVTVVSCPLRLFPLTEIKTDTGSFVPCKRVCSVLLWAGGALCHCLLQYTSHAHRPPPPISRVVACQHATLVPKTPKKKAKNLHRKKKEAGTPAPAPAPAPRLLPPS